jgi:hypothetical protein
MKAEMKVLLAFPGKRTSVYIHDEVVAPYKLRSKVTEDSCQNFKRNQHKRCWHRSRLTIPPSKLPPIYGFYSFGQKGTSIGD